MMMKRKSVGILAIPALVLSTLHAQDAPTALRAATGFLKLL